MDLARACCAGIERMLEQNLSVLKLRKEEARRDEYEEARRHVQETRRRRDEDARRNEAEMDEDARRDETEMVKTGDEEDVAQGSKGQDRHQCGHKWYLQFCPAARARWWMDGWMEWKLASSPVQLWTRTWISTAHRSASTTDASLPVPTRAISAAGGSNRRPSQRRRPSQQADAHSHVRKAAPSVPGEMGGPYSEQRTQHADLAWPTLLNTGPCLSARTDGRGCGRILVPITRWRDIRHRRTPLLDDVAHGDGRERSLSEGREGRWRIRAEAKPFGTVDMLVGPPEPGSSRWISVPEWRRVRAGRRMCARVRAGRRTQGRMVVRGTTAAARMGGMDDAASRRGTGRGDACLPALPWGTSKTTRKDAKC
ncbi:hypothetical protein C8R45DRAFT_1174716 [Mycena sanguinolenta]|nr:hypothetical protein C8R45DRAFT_1174716 [Mycena sanguinolenta]